MCMDVNQEMLMDILRLKKDYRSDPAQFKKQMKASKTLRSFMNREQQEKLDQALSMLERDYKNSGETKSFLLNYFNLL